MNAAVLDRRVLWPLLLGALAFALHETSAAPAPRAAGGPRPTAITLPLPLAWRGPVAGTRMQLDSRDSSVRFRVDTGFGSITADCAEPVGTITFAANGQPGELELRCELRRLRAADDATAQAAKALLGVASGDTVSYRGALQAAETYAQPGVARLTFDGTLALGPQRRRQPMQLWLVLLQPGTVRLQGVGTIDGHQFGLPRRRRAGVLPETSSIDVALDLAFRRAPP